MKFGIAAYSKKTFSENLSSTPIQISNQRFFLKRPLQVPNLHIFFY